MGKIIAVGGGVFWKSKDAEPETTFTFKEIGNCFFYFVFFLNLL